MSFFNDVRKYYGGYEHQDQALAYLDEAIDLAVLETMRRIWRKHFTYFSQRDNLINPYVSCNSSSHAMLVDFMLRKNRRGSLANDNEYVSKVYSGNYGTYGKNNSVSWDIQMKVVGSYGIKCRYNNKGKEALISYLHKGYIAPANFKHKGRLKSPFGGHVAVVVDFDEDRGFLIADPFGSPMPTYVNHECGYYWMSEKEFDARTQGLFTEVIE